MIKFKQEIDENTLAKIINLEKDSINAALDSQKSFSKQILVFLKSFIGDIKTDSILSDKINRFLYDTSFYLSKINSNIDLYNNLLEMLDEIKSTYSQIEYESTVRKINEYNNKYKSSSNKIFKNNSDIETFIHHIASLDISEYISLDNVNTDEDSNNASFSVSNNIFDESRHITDKFEDTSSLIEDTLIISDVSGLVTLPYKVADLKKILHDEPNKYSSLSDVILSKYTVPIRNYKFSAIARFKEAYKLVIEREHGCKKEAIHLATELFSNYNLHPAIITACKNINELDVYLSCLEFNELEDFHFFKIVYEVLPVQSKVNPALF